MLYSIGLKTIDLRWDDKLIRTVLMLEAQMHEIELLSF